MPEERFFYNVTSKSCQFFIDYGCSGSLNSYHSAKECEEACKKADICLLPPDCVPCKDKTQHWFYDPKNKRCKKLASGRCGGNANNFKTRAECQLRCHKR
ncbi:PI-actitoxin-Axm2b-like, partial [Notechis scutatus]|uniref:PI-actitoxin-Axm2b-like n=1 Tax=Notechis scutatus TaxID=8663 RepID=A0A6J1W4J1_9SAUR